MAGNLKYTWLASLAKSETFWVSLKQCAGELMGGVLQVHFRFRYNFNAKPFVLCTYLPNDSVR